MRVGKPPDYIGFVDSDWVNKKCMNIIKAQKIPIEVCTRLHSSQ